MSIVDALLLGDLCSDRRWAKIVLGTGSDPRDYPMKFPTHEIFENLT